MASDRPDSTHVMRAMKLEEPAPAEPTERHPGLLVLAGREIGHTFYFDEDGRTIGRDPEVQIRLRDELISRRHAQVYRQDAEDGSGLQYVLVDLHSTNGTFVNEERISKAFLHDGDKIRLGRAVLKFTLHDEVEHRYSREIQRRIEFDELTGLLTIGRFYERLEQALERAQSEHASLSVVMLDVDGLKAVNDAHGHLAGSHVVKIVAARIAGALEEAAASVGRYGGDEFIAFFTGLDTPAVREHVDRALAAVAAEPFAFSGTPAQVTLSAGIACYPWDCTLLEDLVAAADAALYKAKRAGKNRVEACGRG